MAKGTRLWSQKCSGCTHFLGPKIASVPRKRPLAHALPSPTSDKWSPGVGASGVGHAGAPYSRFFTGAFIIERTWSIAQCYLVIPSTPIERIQDSRKRVRLFQLQRRPSNYRTTSIWRLSSDQPGCLLQLAPNTGSASALGL